MFPVSSDDEEEITMPGLQATQQPDIQNFALMLQAIKSIINPDDISTILRQQSKILRSQAVIEEKLEAYQLEMHALKDCFAEMSQHLKEGSSSSSTSTGDIEQSQSQIDDVKRKTYDGSISVSFKNVHLVVKKCHEIDEKIRNGFERP